MGSPKDEARSLLNNLPDNAAGHIFPHRLHGGQCGIESVKAIPQKVDRWAKS